MKETAAKAAYEESRAEQETMMRDVAAQALRSYEQAIHRGLKFQHEANQMWSNWFKQAQPDADWQKRFVNFGAFANGLLPVTQKRVDELLDLMAQNNRAGSQLMRQASEAIQTPEIGKSQAKWMEFWTDSIGTVRSNTEALAQIQSRALDGWIDFIKRSAEYGESRGSRAAA